MSKQEVENSSSITDLLPLPQLPAFSILLYENFAIVSEFVFWPDSL